MLNSPLPRSLATELDRLSALAHNTAVDMGDSDLPRVEVPQHQGETLSDLNASPEGAVVGKKRAARDSRGGSRKGSRQSASARSAATAANRSAKKAAANVTLLPTSLPNNVDRSAILGPTWNAQDWSCAYDSALMIIFAACVTKSQTWRDRLNLFEGLERSLSLVMEVPPARATQEFNRQRELIRDKLSQQDPVAFPRRGPVTADGREVFEVLCCLPETHDMLVSNRCSRCGRCLEVNSREFTFTTEAREPFEPNQVVQLQDWLFSTVDDELGPVLSSPHDTPCCGLVERKFGFKGAPPILRFRIDPVLENSPPRVDMQYPSTLISYSEELKVKYTLHAVLYHGDNHYMCRLIHSGRVWLYDDMTNGGKAVLESSVAAFSRDLRTCGNRNCRSFVYVRV